MNQHPPGPGSPSPYPHDWRPAGPRQRRRYLVPRIIIGVGLALFMLVCLFCTGMVGLVYFASAPGLFLLANVLALLTAVPYGLLVLWLDRNEKEPLYLIAIAVLWGAVVATLVSMIVNDSFARVTAAMTGDTMVAQALTASFSAPFIEELSKGAAVLLIFLLFRFEFDDVLDGIIYGALVGLGFATVENVIYYFDAGYTAGVGEMGKLAWARGMLGGIGTHAAYTGLTGLGLGLVRVLRKGFARWLLVPLFWGVAMFAHFFWNTFCCFFWIEGDELLTYAAALPLAVVMLQSPFVLMLGCVVIVAWRHENRLILTYLADEQPDVVDDRGRAALIPARRRVWGGFKRFFSGGPVRWWRTRALEKDLIELAFLKWHHHRDLETTWSPDEDADVLKLRGRIRHRRQGL